MNAVTSPPEEGNTSIRNIVIATVVVACIIAIVIPTVICCVLKRKKHKAKFTLDSVTENNVSESLLDYKDENTGFCSRSKSDKLAPTINDSVPVASSTSRQKIHGNGAIPGPSTSHIRQPSVPEPDETDLNTVIQVDTQYVKPILKVQGVMIEILQDDITKIKVDVIVNGTNAYFSAAGAITQAILNSGGPSITTQCEEYLERYGTLEEQTMTGSGSLHCMAIIHTDTQDTRTWQQRIQDTLSYADSRGYTSIAFPAFGTGKLNPIPSHLMAPMMYEGIQQFALGGASSIDHVYIIGFDQNIVSEFEEYITEEHKSTYDIQATDKTIMLQLPIDPPSLEDSYPSTTADQITVNIQAADKTKVQLPYDPPPVIDSYLSAAADQSTVDDGSFKIGSITLTVEQGDITKAHMDAVVNGTNSYMTFNGAVSKSLLKAGGLIFKQECDKIIEHGGRLDKVVLTGAGNLPCQHVVHIDTADNRNWQERIQHALELAETHQLTSVAFPAFGTGKLAMIPIKEMAPMMFQGIQTFAEGYPVYITSVCIMVFDGQLLQEFKDCIAEEHQIYLQAMGTNENATPIQASQVSWEFHDGQAFCAYPQAISDTIEDAYLQGAPLLEWTETDGVFSIDFSTMMELQPGGQQSKVQRKLKC